MWYEIALTRLTGASLPHPEGQRNFNITVEGIRLLRYEMRSGNVVAVFRLDAPTLDWGAGEARWTHDLVLNRASLETRLSNLQAAGYRAEVTTAALKGWPSSPADLLGDGLPAQTIQQPRDPHEVARPPEVEARSAPRINLIVHGKLVTDDGTLECVVVDLSATGAQLSLAASVAAPQIALLHLPNGLVHAVQCKWQRETLAGYMFLSASEATNLSVQPPPLESTTVQTQRNRNWRRLSKMLGLSSSKITVIGRRRSKRHGGF